MNNKDLHKLIEGLNTKIKKLESQVKNNTINIVNKHTPNNQNYIVGHPSSIKAYSISYPKNHDKSKKYIGLMFDDNFNDFSTDSDPKSKNKISFIKMKKANNIINYSICVDIMEIPTNSCVHSISLGIREKNSSKVRLIKGSKYSFDLSNKDNIFGDKLIINNTIIYMSEESEELCMIADLSPKCKINHSKSLIKIMSL
jgi:hypothetical protein